MPSLSRSARASTRNRIGQPLMPGLSARNAGPSNMVSSHTLKEDACEKQPTHKEVSSPKSVITKNHGEEGRHADLDLKGCNRKRMRDPTAPFGIKSQRQAKVNMKPQEELTTPPRKRRRWHIDVQSKFESTSSGVPVALGPMRSFPALSFRERLPGWIKQCLACQRSRRFYAPSKPCCPASRFFDEVTPQSKPNTGQQFIACFHRLSPLKQKTFKRLYEQDPANSIFANDRQAQIPEEAQSRLSRPTVEPELENERVDRERQEAHASPGSCGKVVRVIRRLHKQSGESGISWSATMGGWVISTRLAKTGALLRQTFPLAKHIKQGHTEKQAEERALADAKAAKKDFIRRGIIKDPQVKAYKSQVTGVSWDKSSHSWRVKIQVPVDGKGPTLACKFFRPKIDSQKEIDRARVEAEAAALEMCEQHGKVNREVRMKSMSDLVQRKSTASGVTWISSEDCGCARVVWSTGGKSKSVIFRARPRDGSAEEIDRAFQEAVAWRTNKIQEQTSAEEPAKSKQPRK